MSDLIERQAAIAAIDKEQKEIDVSDVSAMYAYSKCKAIIKQLPSEQPILDARDTEYNLPIGTDTISRQAAIDICDHAIDSFKGQFGAGVLDAIRESIAELPPAEPKTGRWILDRSGAYCCSECMEPCAGYVMMKPRDKFCKMCGSRNEVTE